ncbi:MAG: SDR family NAD(P)-dependent oxidoreductase [Chloroflexota bacterium]
MASYIVTGAAGFIGARVADLLLEAGHTVIGMDNLNDAYDVRVKEWRLGRLVKQPKFVFQKLDISDRHAVANTPLELDGRPLAVEAVFNLAARAGVRASVENPWVYVDTNVTGTLNLLELCRQRGIPKFVLASTSSIYGGDAPLPTPETANSDLPLQPYAASKKGAEALAHSYHYLHGIDVTVFRYFTVYGPGGRPDMSMFRFVQWIFEGRPLRLHGDGLQTRGFTFVDDIARGTILGQKRLGYEVINLGGHEVISINRLIAMLEELIGCKAQVQRGPAIAADMLANQADVSKARRLLDWAPQVSLEAGVRSLVDWYRAERGWASEIDTN